MTTPTPAQQLEEVLSLHTRMVEVRRSGEEATAIHYQREFLCYAAEYVASHADTLRRALAALEAVEKARKRFIVWGSAEGYVTDDEDDAEFARCGFRATATTSLLAEAVRESYAEGDDDEETELHCETVLIIPAAAVGVSRG